MRFDDRLAYLFVLDAVSFCYWGEPKWMVAYGGELYDGAQGMMAALGKAWKKERGLFTSQSLSNMTLDRARSIFDGNVTIPLIKERVHILRELGEVVSAKFGGSFARIVSLAKGDALRMVEMIVSSFPSFSEEYVYKGRTVGFYKRAQLLTIDINYGMTGICFRNVENLTALADYKLPQVLRRYGLLIYGDILEQKIRNKEVLAQGSKEEIEIRAHTIRAVDLLAAAIRERGGTLAVPQINDWLWLDGQRKLLRDEPYHRTLTTAY